MANPDASYVDLAVDIGILAGSIGLTRVRGLRVLRAALAGTLTVHSGRPKRWRPRNWG
jgi:hypothetical protein